MADQYPDQVVDETGGQVHYDWDPNQNPQEEPQYAEQPVVDTTTAGQTYVVHESIRSLLRPAAAEFIGSALFLFVSCGSATTTLNYQLQPGQEAGLLQIGIALTFGFMIFVLCFMIGHISGGHLNFAVTFTFALLRKISVMKAGLYFLAQFLGGLVGIGFLKLVTPLAWYKSCFAVNKLQAADITAGHAFLLEFILTFFLMFVVQAACDSKKSNQTLVPLAIGMTVFVCHMIAIPITGCSINPTRSFASSAAASGLSDCPNAWDYHWIFWFAPLLGAATGGILYEYVYWDGGYKVDALLDMYVLKKPQQQMDGNGGVEEQQVQ